MMRNTNRSIQSLSRRLPVQAIVIAASLVLCARVPSLADPPGQRDDEQEHGHEGVTRGRGHGADDERHDGRHLEGKHDRNERTYYVRQSGSDRNNGLSPGNALRTIQAAVNKCQSGGCTIYVGPGLYAEQVTIDLAHGASGDERRPNRIIADSRGAFTTDPAGPVVIGGDHIRSHGFRIDRRDHWQVAGFRFENQRRQAVLVTSAGSIDVSGCHVEVTSGFGMTFNYCHALSVCDNTFDRDQPGAGAISVIESGGVGHDLTRIANNRFMLTGQENIDARSRSLASRMRSGSTWSAVGILVQSYSSEAPIRIENNIITDTYVGVYVYSQSNRTAILTANNTFAGCYFGMYEYVGRGSVRIIDNICTQSAYAVFAYDRHGRSLIDGLLTHDNYSRNVLAMHGIKVRNLIENQSPQFNAPVLGDYTLKPGSPAIDASQSEFGAATDILGASRPIDGDGDGKAAADLGACEFDPSLTGASRRLHVVQWSELEGPDR